MAICVPDSFSGAYTSGDTTAESKAFSGDKSQSVPSLIPPAMLSSRCPIRISFRLSPVVSGKSKSEVLHDFRCTEWYAGMHHGHTAHPYEYSLELDTKKTLNSRGEHFVVHRLIRSSPDGKLVEISGHCPHSDTSHACNCIKDLCFIYTLRYSQSEVLDNYIKEHVEIKKETESRLPDSETRLAEAKRRLIESRLPISERGLAEAKRRLIEAEMGLGEAETGLADAEMGLSEAEGGLAESVRGLTESVRGLPVSERRVAESKRRVAESMKRVAESERRVAESERRVAESERRVAECLRRLAELLRRLPKSDRGLADCEKRLAESDRRLAESDRRLAESDRRLTESERTLAQIFM